MKFTKILMAVGLAVLLPICAMAQVGFDAYSQMRVLTFGPKNGVGTVTNVFTAGLNVTNGPIDKGAYIGMGMIIINTLTNIGTSTGSLTFQVYDSPDTTNLTAITNFAFISGPTQLLYTNAGYPVVGGTNAAATNYALLPWTPTTPTASSAGFNTPYPVRSGMLSFTNGGSVTVTPGAAQSNTFVMAFPLIDRQRYLYCVWGPSATSGTNLAGTAQLIGIPIQ